MKKIVFAIAAVMGISAQAQHTPEALMAACPDMPSAATMIACAKGECDGDPVGEFVIKVDGVLNKFSEWYSTNVGQPSANRAKREMMQQSVAGSKTTIADYAGMTEAQARKQAMKDANKQMAAYGLSAADVKAIQNGTMNEEAIINKMMAAQMGTNMTMADVKKMGKMNAAQREQYAKDKGLTIDKKKAASLKSKGAKMEKEGKIAARIAEITDRLTHLATRPYDKMEEAKKWGEEQWKTKYAPRVSSLMSSAREIMKDISDGENADAYKAEWAQVDALTKQADDLEKEFDGQYITMWRNAVIAAMDVVRVQELPLQYQLKEAYEDMYKQTNNPAYLGSERFPFDSAVRYLEIAKMLPNMHFDK
ncbi:MAG: hypothetical protein Q4B68_10880 [Bacteroidales bacterium]|nr:hypothetical protein [Bacteroidales bacterium]